MRLCTHCAGEVGAGERFCRRCGEDVAETHGHTLDLNEVRRDLATAFGEGGKLAAPGPSQSSTNDRAAQADGRAQPSGAPPAEPASEVSRTSSGSPLKLIAGAALALILGAVVTLVVLNAYPVAPQSAPGSDASSTAPVHPSDAASDAISAPKWSSANRLRWVANRSSDVAYELEAENKVPVWLGQVRPILVVRCYSRKVDVFVYTESAARIEPQDEDHTVRLAFDKQGSSTERWPDSAEHDALFAPDGTAFARRLARARTLRFGFTPHNAPPAVAEFDLRGVERVAAAVQDCSDPRRAPTKVASR